MKIFSKRAKVLVISLGIATVTVSAAQAALVTQDTTNNTNDSWSQAATWDNNNPASVGNDYVTPSGFVLRSPAYYGPGTAFPGDSLTIYGALGLTPSSTGSLTFSDLTIDGGNLGIYTASNDRPIYGNITLANDVRFSNSSGRSLYFEAAIGGSGTTSIVNGGRTILVNPANTYGGTWIISDGQLVTSGGTLGDGASMAIAGANTSDYIELDYDWVTNGTLTVTGGLFYLSHDHTVSSFVVGSTVFGPGVYTHADLDSAGFGSLFTDDGGSITVVPEPATAALFALGGITLVGLHRRKAA